MKRFSNFMGRDFSVEFDAESQSFFAQTQQEPDFTVSLPAPIIQLDATPLEAPSSKTGKKKRRAGITIGRARKLSADNIQITGRNRRRLQKTLPTEI